MKQTSHKQHIQHSIAKYGVKEKERGGLTDAEHYRK